MGLTPEQILNTICEKLATWDEWFNQKIYDNKGIMEKLNIKDKYLKKLRDNGYIGYTRHGDKYWYTQKDINDFMQKFHYDAFSNESSLPAF